MKKKIIIAIIALLVVGGVGTASYFGVKSLKASTSANEAGTSVYVQTVADIMDMGVASTINRYSGRVDPQETLDIEVSQEKEVKEVLVEEGEEIAVGTPLFIYDTETMEEELAQAGLEIERIDHDILTAQEEIKSWEKEKKTTPADQQLAITTKIQEAQTDIKRSEYERKSKELSMEQLQKSIDSATVNSQIDGVVKSINKDQTTNSMTGEIEPFMRILTLGDFRISGKINELNAMNLQPGERMIIRSRVDEDAIWIGALDKVDYDNPQNGDNNFYGGSNTESTTTYPFYVVLESSEGLKLGQHVYMERDLGQEEKKEGLWLAYEYIVMEDDKAYVWASDSKERLVKKEVTLGELDESLMQYEILEGLELQDQLAFPEEHLKEGMKTTTDITEVMNPEDGMIQEGGMIDEGGMIQEGGMIEEDGMIPEDGIIGAEDEMMEGGQIIEGEEGMMMPESSGSIDFHTETIEGEMKGEEASQPEVAR